MDNVTASCSDSETESGLGRNLDAQLEMKLALLVVMKEVQQVSMMDNRRVSCSSHLGRNLDAQMVVQLVLKLVL